MSIDYINFNINQLFAIMRNMCAVEVEAFIHLFLTAFQNGGEVTHEEVYAYMKMRPYAHDAVAFVLQQNFEKTPDGWLSIDAEERVQRINGGINARKESGKNAANIRWAKKRASEGNGLASDIVDVDANHANASNRICENMPKEKKRKENLFNKKTKAKKDADAPPPAPDGGDVCDFSNQRGVEVASIVANTSTAANGGAKAMMPEGCNDDDWDAVIAAHGTKPLTVAKLKAIEQAAKSVGYSLNEAIAKMAAKNWRNFEAAWVEPKQPERERKPYVKPTMPVVEGQITVADAPAGQEHNYTVLLSFREKACLPTTQKTIDWILERSRAKRTEYEPDDKIHYGALAYRNGAEGAPY